MLENKICQPEITNVVFLPVFYPIVLYFEGDGGLEWIDRNVSGRIQGLPGFEGLTKVSDKIGQIVAQQTSRQLN